MAGVSETGIHGRVQTLKFLANPPIPSQLPAEILALRPGSQQVLTLPSAIPLPPADLESHWRS